MSNPKKRALVIFGKDTPRVDLSLFDKVFKDEELERLIGPGSIYEAGELLKELSKLNFSAGSTVSKRFIYKGFELWWVHYSDLFFYFCLPYTQYKRMLEELKNYKEVRFYNTPYKSLFYHYLDSYGVRVHIIGSLASKIRSVISPGILVQILITLLSLPILFIKQKSVLLFIGDKFEKGKDYDFRMKFLYEEVRKRNLYFVEFIRSIEPVGKIVKNFLVRKRPVVYSQAIVFISRYLSIISGGQNYTKEPEKSFKLRIATHYLENINENIWAIRIMKFITKLIGVKSAYITAANERNFHTVLGCKLNKIPTVGILHGMASLYGTPYDFLVGFSGEKMLSVDKYGLWSEWWKENYIKNSNAYRPEQLYVSGPMRPIEQKTDNRQPTTDNEKIRVLYIAEQVAEPREVLPYLKELLNYDDFEVTIKFRPYRDGFEEWLKGNEPSLLQNDSLKKIYGSMEDAIKETNIVVGSYSTAVIESLMQLKVPIFCYTNKWGDYYNMGESETTKELLARNPAELIEKVNNSRSISTETLKELRERYFGDPTKNGSKWVVDRLEELL